MPKEKLQKAMQYAKENPNSAFAVELSQRVQRGEYNNVLESEGIDTSRFKKPKKDSFFKRAGEALIKSEKEFGTSIAGAIETGLSKFGRGSFAQTEETQTQDAKTTSQLLSAIRDKKNRGEDTAKLEKILNSMGESRSGLLERQAGLSVKQVLGQAGGVAVDIAGGASLGKVGAGIVTKPTTLGAGVVQGAKQGVAVGGAFGAGQGLAHGAQEDLGTAELAKETVIGGVAGGVAGGFLGGIAGGASGAIRGRDVARQEKILDFVTPETGDLTPAQFKDFLNKGQITPKTTTQSAKFVLSNTEKETALRFPQLIQKDPVRTSLSISDEIGRLDSEVEIFLRGNNSIFSKGELKNTLTESLKDITDIAIDEKRITKGKEALISNFLKKLTKNDMLNLWKERKLFDQQIENAFKGSATLQKELKREFRNAIQDFIKGRTTDDIYSSFMGDMTNLFRLRDTVGVKATKERALSAIRLWIKNNPSKAKAVGWGTGLFIANEVFSPFD